MKKFCFLFFFFPILLLTGCGDKKVDYATINRDNYSTGGDITFSYDNITHTACFGEKNEVLAYYETDIVKGWNEPGNRVGIKLVSPVKIINPLSARASIGGVEYEHGSFYKSINNEISNIAEFYPLVDEQNRALELKIIWQDGVEEQTYKIIIKEGTIFMKSGY